ncbi:MAG: hypothetical protein ACRDZ2_16445 [Ilumatobacteraceae bacterium]
MSNTTTARSIDQRDTPLKNRVAGPLLVRRAVVLLSVLSAGRRLGEPPRRRGHGDHGQATTEYALVLLAAALVALLVVAWATAGGGAARIGGLFDRVIDAVTDRI